MRVPFACLVLGMASAALCASPRVGHAQTFNVLYDFTGSSGSQVSENPTTVSSGITAGSLGRGAGLTTATNGGQDSINSMGFETSTSLVANDYYTFSVGPTAGNRVNFSTLAYTDRHSGSGPASFSVRSSVDGYATSLLTYNISSTNTSNVSHTLDLSSVGTLQNLSSSVEFRIYGYNASGSTGTYRILSPSAGTGLTISGTFVTAAAAPEPGTLALLGTVAVPGMGLLAARRRRARKTA